MSSTSIPVIGDVIGGRYQIQSVVASGGMGVVMRGQHVKMGRDVAIKFLHSHLIQDTDIRQRFEREVDIAKDLTHPNVVHVYDYGETNSGNLYLVMEYLEGDDLKHVLRQAGRFNAGRALDIMTQILDGLAEAHIRKIVHRDLKPANIFMTTDRHGNDLVKILDFGIAKSLQADQGITKAGMLCGTVAYMAPEAILAGGDTPSCDVYAAGLILLEMLTGTRAFRGETVAQTMMMQIQNDAVIPQRLENTPLGVLLRQATDKNPENRFLDADGMLLALQKITDQVDPNFQLTDEEVPAATTEAVNSASDLYRPHSIPNIPIPSVPKPAIPVPGPTPDSQANTQHIAFDDLEFALDDLEFALDDLELKDISHSSQSQAAPPTPNLHDSVQSTPHSMANIPVVTSSSSSTALHHHKPARSRKPIFIAIAVILGVSVAVIAIVAGTGKDTPQNTPDTPPTTAQPTTIAATEPPTSPDRQPKLIINIQTTPAGANLFLDNVPLGSSPVTVTLKPDELPAQLRMELDGYHEQSHLIETDSSDTLSFDLKETPSEELAETNHKQADSKPPAEKRPTPKPPAAKPPATKRPATKPPAAKPPATKAPAKKPDESSVDDLLKQYLD